MEDVNGAMVDIYLYNDDMLPVPRFVTTIIHCWKISSPWLADFLLNQIVTIVILGTTIHDKPVRSSPL